MLSVPNPFDCKKSRGATFTVLVYLGTNVNQMANLPTNALGWLDFLHDDFARTGDITTARALFRLLLLGQFEGRDVFGVQGACNQAKVPQFAKRATIHFGVGGRPATKNQAWLYIDIIASLVKREFTLYDLLPRFIGVVDQSWVQPFADTSADVILKGKNHVCWKLARKLKSGHMGMLSQAQRHAFLILWIFWVMSNHECFVDGEEINFFRFHQPQVTDLSEFVELAK